MIQSNPNPNPNPCSSSSSLSSPSPRDTIKKMNILDGRFFTPIVEKCTESQAVALCVKCSPAKIEIKGHARSSSNFVCHLRRVHGENVVKEYQEYAQNVRKTANQQQQPISHHQRIRKVKSCSQQQFEENIFKFVLHSMAPLSLIEDPFFNNIFRDLDISSKGLKMITRRNLTRKMNSVFNENMQSLKVGLSNVKYVSTSADIWSSGGGGRCRNSFLGVTVHWIEETNLERRSAAIAARRIGNSDTAEKIAELLDEIHNEFGFYPSKITATLTDNGNDCFLKSFKDYCVENKACEVEGGENYWYVAGKSDSRSESADSDRSTPDREEEEEESGAAFTKVSLMKELSMMLPNHVRCCARTLNLCAFSDVPKVISQSQSLSVIHNRVMAKCNTLWLAVARPKSSEILREILGYTLCRPGEAGRWNSLYDAFEEIVKMKDKCREVFEALKIQDTFVLTEYDFTYIEEHLECAKPVATALDILQGDKFTYYGTTMPILFALLHKLETLNRKEWRFCKIISDCFLNSVRNRFSEFYNFSSQESLRAAIAALSHPEFKNRWLIRGDIQHHQSNIMWMFKEEVVAAAAAAADNNSFATIFDEKQQQQHQNNKPSSSNFFNFGEEIAPIETITVESEILQFLNDIGQSLDMLDKYPRIKKVFIKFNTPLPSSAAVERLFSSATMTKLTKSNKLSDKDFEIRVLMKANSNFFKLN